MITMYELFAKLFSLSTNIASDLKKSWKIMKINLENLRKIFPRLAIGDASIDNIEYILIIMAYYKKLLFLLLLFLRNKINNVSSKMAAFDERRAFFDERYFFFDERCIFFDEVKSG